MSQLLSDPILAIIDRTLVLPRSSELAEDGLPSLMILSGSELGLHRWNPGVSKSSDPLPTRPRSDPERFAGLLTGILMPEAETRGLSSFSSCSIDHILHSFRTREKIEALSEEMKWEDKTAEQALHLLGNACERPFDFLSIPHEVIFGRSAGRTVFCASNGTSDFTLAVELGDEGFHMERDYLPCQCEADARW